MNENESLKTSISDWFSVILCIISAAITFFTSNLEIENKTILCAFAFAAQFLVIIAWLFVFTNIIKTKNIINKKDIIINGCIKEKELIGNQLNVISASIKSNSMHNNEALLKISQAGNKQYSIIDGLKKISDNGKNHPEQVEMQLKNNAEDYKHALFNVYNRYCRDTLDEIVKFQKACLLTRNIDIKISVTIKLFVKPYSPKEDNDENICIYTSFRDNETYTSRIREIGDKIYTIRRNSDFVQCLSEDSFIKNNINKSEGNYINEDQSFLDYYNCTVVVPIRQKRIDNEYIYLGYLCCDCLNNNPNIKVFDTINANYLFATAQNIATFLETLNSNWKDRFEIIDHEEQHILEILYKKIYKHVTH